MAQAVGTEGQFHYLVQRLEDDVVVGEIGAAVDALVAKLRAVPEVRRFVAHAPLEHPESGRVVETAGFAMVREVNDTDEAGNVLRVREWELTV